MGESIVKTYVLPKKSIFWTKGIKSDKDNNLKGGGLLNLELVLLDGLGFDLQQNPYALNETIRILIRTLVPFIVFFIVALLVRVKFTTNVERFYIKMKVLVDSDPVIDQQNLEHAYANPESVQKYKLFPNSNWEFDRWDRQDWTGFLISVIIVVLLVGFMSFLVSIGA